MSTGATTNGGHQSTLFPFLFYPNFPLSLLFIFIYYYYYYYYLFSYIISSSFFCFSSVFFLNYDQNILLPSSFFFIFLFQLSFNDGWIFKLLLFLFLFSFPILLILILILHDILISLSYWVKVLQLEKKKNMVRETKIKNKKRVQRKK